MHSTIAPIVARVSKWTGVETESIGEGVSFRLDGREFARISEGGMLTVSTTPPLRNQLLTDGFADSIPQRRDWVSYRIRSSADVSGAIRLLRVSYISHQRGEAPHRTPAETLNDHVRRLDASSELLGLLSTQPTRSAETDHERRIA